MAEPSLKVHDGGAPATPSEELIKSALQPEVIKFRGDDGAARSVLLRKPGVLAPFQLVDALGGDTASNQAYMTMIAPLIYVGEIDGEPVYPPASKAEVEAVISRLGEAGFGAITEWWMEKVYAPAVAKMDEAKRQAQEKERLKNS